MRVLFRASSIALATSLVVVGIAGGQASQPAPAPLKIGYINSAQLLAQAPGRAEAEAQFDREVGVYRQQIQRMDDSLKTLMAAFDRDAPKLDSVTRDARRTSIGQREAEYQGRRQLRRDSRRRRSGERRGGRRQETRSDGSGAGAAQVGGTDRPTCERSDSTARWSDSAEEVNGNAGTKGSNSGDGASTITAEAIAALV